MDVTFDTSDVNIWYSISEDQTCLGMYNPASMRFNREDSKKFDLIDLSDINSIASLAESMTGVRKKIFPVGNRDVLGMLRYGFVPDVISVEWISDVLDRIPIMLFLGGLIDYKTMGDLTSVMYGPSDKVVPSYREIQTISKYMVWEYIPMNILKSWSISTCRSMPLMLRAKDMVYPGSNRVKTDMSSFRTCSNHTISKSDIVWGHDRRDHLIIKVATITLGDDTFYAVPVTRYVVGMSGGLYFGSDRPSDTCGVFYYYDEDSTTLLAYKTSHRGFNKTDAIRLLGTNEPWATNNLMRHSTGDLPRDLVITIGELATIKGKQQLLKGAPHNIVSMDVYAGMSLGGLYAEEDELDQSLCLRAREKGYDIVILDSMPGSRQVVTEILDTREMSISYRSLVYIVD